MQKSLLALCCLAVVVLEFVTSKPAAARPNYAEAYRMRHPAVTQKCAICHIGKPNEKKWNDYGTAFGDALGAKNVKDLETILKAIDKADEVTGAGR